MAETIEVKDCSVVVEKDINDSSILATLMISQADWLITGDMVLLELQKEYPIISVAEFAKKISLSTE
jgi:predicted nucleic acid-binding protein